MRSALGAEGVRLSPRLSSLRARSIVRGAERIYGAKALLSLHLYGAVACGVEGLPFALPGCDVPIFRTAVRLTTISGCAIAFACALLIVWTLVVHVSMTEQLWVAWTRLMLTGKVLAIIGRVGESDWALRVES